MKNSNKAGKMKKARNILLAPFILVWAVISLPWELPKAMARVLSAIEEGSKAWRL